jgi:hypothetical protein
MKMKQRYIILHPDKHGIYSYLMLMCNLPVGLPAEVLLVVVLQDDVTIVFLMVAPVIDIV